MSSSGDRTLAAVKTAAAAASSNVAGNGVIEVSDLQLLSLVLALLLVFFVSQRLQLGVEKQLAVGAIRCFIQLTALGLVLVPIIMYNYAPLVLGYIVIMMLVAAVEAAARPPFVFDSIVIICFVSITTSVFVFSTFTFAVVLRTGLDAQYFIPITGMITGSAMSAVSVCLSNIVTEFAERKSNMEVLLALGATRWEASMDIVKSSIVLGLTPTLNLLAVTGLVTIPGMMTGQIIGGTPPGLAAKYQLVIMYIAAGSATISTLTAGLLTIYVLIDSEYRIRGEKLAPRDAVNRLASIIITVRCLASKLVQWRGRVQQRRSPFPPYVNDPIPETHITTPSATTSPPKTGDGVSGYGATSASNQEEENF